MDKEYFLTIKDLMNFHYCKRLIYFENVLRVPQATTIKEFKGRELHNLFERKAKRNKLIKGFQKFRKIFHLNLKSREFNFRTVLDCLVVNNVENKAYPIEYKNMKKPEKLYRTLKIQVLAESLLVESQLKYKTPFAFIKFEKSNDITKIVISEKDLEEVKETIKEINNILEKELVPEPTTFKKRCTDCCYWNICRRI